MAGLRQAAGSRMFVLVLVNRVLFSASLLASAPLRREIFFLTHHPCLGSGD